MNQIVLSPLVIHDWLRYFGHKLEEVTIQCSPDLFIIRSHDDTIDPDTSVVQRTLKTEMTIDINDFDHYDIAQEATLSFSLKEFKSVLSFAEASSLPVKAVFGQAGDPIIFNVVHQGLFDADFVLATMEDTYQPNHADVTIPVDTPRATYKSTSTSQRSRSNLLPSSFSRSVQSGFGGGSDNPIVDTDRGLDESADYHNELPPSPKASRSSTSLLSRLYQAQLENEDGPHMPTNETNEIPGTPEPDLHEESFVEPTPPLRKVRRLF